MNNKQKETLKSIFSANPPKDMPWKDIESLFVSIGAKVTEVNGSRVKFDMNGITIAFHRPHKPKIAKKYQIEIAKDFFSKLGIVP